MILNKTDNEGIYQYSKTVINDYIITNNEMAAAKNNINKITDDITMVTKSVNLFSTKFVDFVFNFRYS